MGSPRGDFLKLVGGGVVVVGLGALALGFKEVQVDGSAEPPLRKYFYPKGTPELTVDSILMSAPEPISDPNRIVTFSRGCLSIGSDGEIHRNDGKSMFDLQPPVTETLSEPTPITFGRTQKERLGYQVAIVGNVHPELPGIMAHAVERFDQLIYEMAVKAGQPQIAVRLEDILGALSVTVYDGAAINADGISLVPNGLASEADVRDYLRSGIGTVFGWPSVAVTNYPALDPGPGNYQTAINVGALMQSLEVLYQGYPQKERLLLISNAIDQVLANEWFPIALREMFRRMETISDAVALHSFIGAMVYHYTGESIVAWSTEDNRRTAEELKSEFWNYWQRMSSVAQLAAADRITSGSLTGSIQRMLTGVEAALGRVGRINLGAVLSRRTLVSMLGVGALKVSPLGGVVRKVEQLARQSGQLQAQVATPRQLSRRGFLNPANWANS